MDDKQLLAGIITIGDELLIGQTINTNAAWMGEQLSFNGIEVHQNLTIRDTEEEILASIDYMMPKVDVILMSGGLGPTKDDITKYTLCKYFDSRLERNQEVENRVKEYFDQRNRPMLEVNYRQADLPHNAEVIPNFNGTASGMLFQKNGKILVSMPGVPYEMKAMVSDFVIPIIQETFELTEIFNRTIRTIGIGESYLAEILEKWETNLRSNGLGLAYLPSPGEVKLRISAKNIPSTKLRVDHFAEQLYTLIPEYIYGEGTELIQEKVGRELSRQQKTLAIAESCTGGFLAHTITSVSGSSNYFWGSVVAYENEVKIKFVGVERDSIIDHGAVSKEVVEQLAINVRNKFGSSIGLATSGIAGPTGGTKEKPVGTIWIAMADGDSVYSELLQLGNNRLRNVTITSKTLLMRLFKKLENK